jgi:hypothetical protein
MQIIAKSMLLNQNFITDSGCNTYQVVVGYGIAQNSPWDCLILTERKF